MHVSCRWVHLILGEWLSEIWNTRSVHWNRRSHECRWLVIVVIFLLDVRRASRRSTAIVISISITVSFVWSITSSIHFLLLFLSLVLVPLILEPDFHLRRRQIDAFGQLFSITRAQIFVDGELVLQNMNLLRREQHSPLSSSDSRKHNIRLGGGCDSEAEMAGGPEAIQIGEMRMRCHGI